MPNKDKDDVAVTRAKAPSSKAIKLNGIDWGKTEHTILRASASVLLLLYCLELVGHKLLSIAHFILNALSH